MTSTGLHGLQVGFLLLSSGLCPPFWWGYRRPWNLTRSGLGARAVCLGFAGLELAFLTAGREFHPAPKDGFRRLPLYHRPSYRLSEVAALGCIQTERAGWRLLR